MLEKMDVFFNSRLNGYEEHQLHAIASAQEFYPFTAGCLPRKEGAHILDLGCGTGLELGYYFQLNPTAAVTGIDLAQEMLEVLKEKFADRAINIIHGSYFDIPFAPDFYDAAVSVESLHHFTKAEKVPLYQKIHQSLVPGGYLILTDYFASSEASEADFRAELIRLKAAQGIDDKEFYHYDTPLTVEHETQALKEAGFSSVEVLRQWDATCTIKAEK